MSKMLLARPESFWHRVFHRHRVDSDLDDEIRGQIELTADQKLKSR